MACIDKQREMEEKRKEALRIKLEKANEPNDYKCIIL